MTELSKSRARESRHGIFFLEEIAECSLEVQAKLLRVIRQKEVLPLGSLAPHKINVKFISATTRDLNEMVQAGSFRLDLLNRLDTFEVRMPALRERKHWRLDRMDRSWAR